MRKPRDYDAELKALDQRARELRARKVQQYGELVIATDAERLPIEMLAGALIATVAADDKTREVWKSKGAAFFQGKRRSGAGHRSGDDRTTPETGSAAQG